MIVSCIGLCGSYFIICSGDMELKKDKSLPAEKQILTANPDINIVRKSILNAFFFFI